MIKTLKLALNLFYTFGYIRLAHLVVLNSTLFDQRWQLVSKTTFKIHIHKRFIEYVDATAVHILQTCLAMHHGVQARTPYGPLVVTGLSSG